MPIITVVATVKAKAGHEEKVKKALLELTEATHHEPGCQKYDLHQSIESRGTFVFLETWASVEALDAHMKTPHIAACREKIKDSLDAEIEIRKLAKIG